ncbi:MAG: hypothetical protein FWC35_04175, partial [Proteobacteria bacterium]|nr:hypothetical protein [Pseudomonadota bacterium]
PDTPSPPTPLPQGERGDSFLRGFAPSREGKRRGSRHASLAAKGRSPATYALGFPPRFARG